MTTDAAQAHTHPVLEAYCVKCKQKREMLHVHEEILEGDRQHGGSRRIAKGVCKACNTKVNRLLPSSWPRN